MPKEVIASGVQGNITVGWNAEHGNAQVGVDLGNEFTFVNDKTGDKYTGLWVTLTQRDDFNRLIKALRRARDAIHGEDA